jgi:hypothetical protein
LKAAITSGQYTHPKGLFYGGQFETWSNHTIRTIARRYCANAQRLIFVDYHTGLGPYGRAEVILTEAEQSPAFKRALTWWGDRVRTTVSGESVSSHVQGAVASAFQRALPHAEVTAVGLEFGTFSGFRVLWALRAENWLHHHGGTDHRDAARIKAELLEAFYPNTADWKATVWEQGKEVIDQALYFLNQRPQQQVDRGGKNE